MSDDDIRHLNIIRTKVNEWRARAREEYPDTRHVLDIGTEGRAGADQFWEKVETLGLNASENPTHVADLCSARLSHKLMRRYDVIMCTEVLEHVQHPFMAVVNLWRMLRPGGSVYITTPFNFFIHEPSPDCWRFTAEGIKSLMEHAGFEDYTVQPVNGERHNMPIQYLTKATRGMNT